MSDNSPATALPFAGMGNSGKLAVSQLFVAHIQAPRIDPTVARLRDELTAAKRETLDALQDSDEQAVAAKMPELYRKIISMTIQVAARVGIGVGLALEAFDELSSGVSISSFSRTIREQMTATGVAMKNRHATPIAKLVADIEACRLAWRHNHEFLSWLAFRREDERYSAEDRQARLVAFKVQSRLLQSREGVVRTIGHDMAVALEAHDRFMLANRWRLAPTAEHAVERYVWPLLSYQRAEHVLVESARHDFDALTQLEATEHDLELAGVQLQDLFRDELCASLDALPHQPLLLPPATAMAANSGRTA